WFVLSFIQADNKKIYLLYLGIVLVGGLVVALILKNYIIEMFHRFFDSNYSSLFSNITTGRTEIWSKYFKRFLKSPITFLFGNGHTAPRIDTNQYEHSIYLAFLNQFGVIGSAILIGAIVWTFKQNCKFSNKISNYLLLCILLFNGLVENLIGLLYTCLIWFITFYFITQPKNDKSEINNKPNSSNIKENTNE
ncbi:MAG: O-antigen ligase family protein, partial [Clostridia bacterium]